MAGFVNAYLKFFFLLTPFFVLSSFLSLTAGQDTRKRQLTVVKVVIAVIIICLILFLLGNQLFALFGITLDAFRVGTGVLLLLSAVALVRGTSAYTADSPDQDVSVVPLAIPITVGPGTTGALLVMGSEPAVLSARLPVLGALFAAIFSVGIILMLGTFIEKLIKRQGILILSKLTGLVIAAIAAQLILTGFKNFIA